MIRFRGIPLTTKVPSLALALLVALGVWRYWEVRTGGAATAQENRLRPRPELLVDAAWLNGHRDDGGLRIVDLRDAASYNRGHIPGAVRFDQSDLRTEMNGVPGMLPPIGQVEAALRRAGIGAETTVVIHDGGRGLLAARMFWALDYLGQGRGRLLDGGWQAWLDSGHPVSLETPTVAESGFRARPRENKVADLAWMKDHVGAEDVVFVDARSPQEYEGKRGGSRRSGHIPGAFSMEWINHLRRDGRFRDPAELTETYRILGVTPDKTVAPYCQSYMRAAHTYFTLKWLGFSDVRGYDGSWAEWGNRGDTPIETGAPAASSHPAAETQAAAAPDGGETGLRPGISFSDARRLLGEPARIDSQNPCWGELAIWHYPRGASRSGGALQLTFVDGKLKEISAAR